MSSDSEMGLLKRCKDGDPEAWNELFDRYYSVTGRFLFQLGPEFSREDVEEICQETFLAVIRSLSTFHGTSQFQTWLFRIATNKARDYWERKRAVKRGGGQMTLPLHAPRDGLAVDVPSVAPGPDDLLLTQERMLLLRQALDELGDPCRSILELRYFAEFSYGQIANSLKLHEKTVSSRLSKCLDRLEPIVKSLFNREKRTTFSV